MGSVESKVPEEFATLPETKQLAYRRMFKRLTQAGADDETAFMELMAIYGATEDPSAFVAGVDVNHDGKVSVEELEQVMVLAGASEKSAHAAAKAVIHAADIDGDGQVDSTEAGVYASAPEVRRSLANGALVLDVREVSEEAELPNPVPNSFNVPCLWEDHGLSFRSSFRSLPIIVHSHAPGEGKDTARLAVKELHRMGFVNVLAASSGSFINDAVKAGPSLQESQEQEELNRGILEAKAKYERAARIAAKAATTQTYAKAAAATVAGEAADAANTKIRAKEDYERAGRLAAKAAATMAAARADYERAGKIAAQAAVGIIAARADYEQAGKLAAEVAATQAEAKAAAKKVGEEAAHAAAVTTKARQDYENAGRIAAQAATKIITAKRNYERAAIETAAKAATR